jgi:hypothetical protein
MFKNQKENNYSSEDEGIIDINNIEPLISANNKNLTKMKKGKGRRVKNSKEFCLKSKDSNENICKKIKTHFLKYLIYLVNNLIFDYFKEKKFVFRKLNNSLSKSSIQYNKELFEKPIREILSQEISSKFKTINKNINQQIIKKLENIDSFKKFFSFELKYIYSLYINNNNSIYKEFNFQNLLENERKLCYKNNINDLNFNIDNYLKKFEEIGINFINKYIKKNK